MKSFLGQLLKTFGDILLVMLGPSNPIEYFLVQSSLLLLLLLVNGARFGYMTNIWLKKPTCLPRIIYVYKQKHIFPAFVCGQWSIKPLNPSNYSCWHCICLLVFLHLPTLLFTHLSIGLTINVHIYQSICHFGPLALVRNQNCSCFYGYILSYKFITRCFQ